MPDPWYSDGLEFSCTRCGNCCTGQPGFVWVNLAEIDAIAALLGQPVDETVAMHTRMGARGRSLREKANGDCAFYDRQQGCTIYEARPRQCRSWPFWDSTAGTPEGWERTRKSCPGAGRGELIAPEEITRRRRLISI